MTLAATISAAEVFPLSEVRAGQRGTGKTVFSGATVESFDVEVLGVLENVGPKQSLILARLSGGPLEKTGVMAGMSGSPVYIDGRLAGAVAFSFPFSTEPLCGIRPIREMLAADPEGVETAQSFGRDYAAMRSGEVSLLPFEPASRSGDALIPIATPVAFGGFTPRTLDRFGDTLKALGIRPLQGIGGRSAEADQAPVEPGSMISVGLIRGDMNAVASGTVTHIEDDRLYAFGHAFLQSGPTELPMMKASVLALAPNLSNSFKLSGAGGPLGKITLDRTAAVVGEIGAEPAMTPLAVSVRRGGREERYEMELARDAYLTPFLLQMATFSALDVGERQIGPSTLRVAGTAKLANAPALELADVYAGQTGASFAAASGTAAPLAYLLQIAPEASVESIDITVEADPGDATWSIVDAWSDRAEVRAGDSIELAARLRGPRGEYRIIRRTYQAPPYLRAGELRVSFSDALRLNVADFPLLMESEQLSAAELVELINNLRRSDGLYLRIERGGAAYRIGGRRLSALPPSFRSAVEAGGAPKETTEVLLEETAWRAAGAVAGRAELRLVVTE